MVVTLLVMHLLHHICLIAGFSELHFVVIDGYHSSDFMPFGNVSINQKYSNEEIQENKHFDKSELNFFSHKK